MVFNWIEECFFSLVFWLGVFNLGEVIVVHGFLFVKRVFVCLLDFCYWFALLLFWFGDHSGGVTPGLVSIPEVKSSCVFCGTVGVPMGSFRRCRPSHNHLLD